MRKIDCCALSGQVRALTRNAATVALASLLTACAVSDEGASDFRIVQAAAAIGGSNWTKLVDDSEVDDPIMEGDALQLVLKTAFINDFWAVFGTPGVSGGAPNGEIAIVAAAHEDDGKIAYRFGADAIDNAKVIYFNDDVIEGQFLNFSPGLPIYGPTAYSGYPLRLDLWVIELDQPGEQLRNLLQVLATLGSTAYPPASPIAGPMAKLASTLISDRQDDPAFHYTLTLRPIGNAVALRAAVLEPTEIAFVREKQRNATTNWDKLRYNARTGRLVHDREECIGKVSPPAGCDYREQTYLIVEVSRARKALELSRVQLGMDELRRQFGEQSAPIFTEAGLTNARAAFGELGVALASRDRADNLNGLLAELQGRGDCNAMNEPTATRRRAAEAFLSDWLVKGGNGSDLPAISAGDDRKMLTRVGNIVGRTATDTVKFNGLMEGLRGRKVDASSKTAITTALAACPPAKKKEPEEKS